MKKGLMALALVLVAGLLAYTMLALYVIPLMTLGIARYMKIRRAQPAG